MKKNKIGKTILIIFLSLIIVGVSYIGSFYLDKIYKYYGNVSIKVTFDDTKTYVIPDSIKSTKEKALTTWPYMFTIENSGDRKGLYEIIIKDIDTSTIKRNDLKYILFLDDKEIKEDFLSNVKNDVLYTHAINKNSTQRYKLYIYSISDNTLKDDIYEYQLSLNAIKDGGPGFKK